MTHLLLEGVRLLHWDTQKPWLGAGMLQRASRKC